MSNNKDAMRDSEYVWNQVLADERIKIALKFFNLVRLVLPPEDQGEFTAEFLQGKKLPRLIILAKDKKPVKFEGRVSITSLLGSFREIIRNEFKQDLGKFTSDFIKYLNDLEEVARLEEKAKKLETKLLEKKPSLAEIDARNKLVKEVQEQQISLKQRLEALLQLTVPAAPVPVKVE